MSTLAETLLVVMGVLNVLTIGLTLLGAFFYPRTMFGNLILLGGAYLIAELFALEETPRRMVPVVIAIPFVVAFLAISIHSARACARGADAELWARAGVSGAYLMWQSYIVRGKAARRYWLWRAVCAAAIGIVITTGVTIRMLDSRQVTIDDVEKVAVDLNESHEGWESWPSPEIQAQAGTKSWGDWRPHTGDVGTIIWWMNPSRSTKYFSQIYVLEVRDAAGTVHYVAVPRTSTTKVVHR